MRRIASRWLLSVVLVLGVSSSADAAIIESVEFLTGTDAKVLELGEFGAGNYEVTVTDHLFPEALSVLMFNVVSATESFGSLGEAGSFIFSLAAPTNLFMGLIWDAAGDMDRGQVGIQVATTEVPEPATLLLMAIGITPLVVGVRRRS